MSMNPAASANGLAIDHFPAHGHALHIHQQSQHRDNWPQMLPQNQHQQFHGSPWQQSQPAQLPSASPPIPQMQIQGYPNPPQYYQNPSTLPFDISSLVPQQIMQDFLRLSTPVGSSPNDDTILAQALHDGRQSGKTYRQALEGLHGVNNHAANLWKDYYLDHHDRFDVLVSRLAEQPKTVKKPFVPSKSPPHVRDKGPSHQVARKRYHSPPPPPAPLPPPRPSYQSPKKKTHSFDPLQASRPKRATPQAVTSTSSALTRPPKRPRATFNSLSAPLPCNDVPNLMPPQVHIPIPDPPSRSPTPPAIVQVGTNGNKYTKEDREYFIRFLGWRLKQDPSLTKKELCELLHKKAPHHSATSWASHWHQRHDIADKILATYHGGNSEAGAGNDEDQQNEEEEVEVEEEINEDEDEDVQSEAMSTNEPSRVHKGARPCEGTFLDFGDPDVDTEEDEADMGEPGSSFTRGDWCILARFIARNRWDDSISRRERWHNFTETHGTKRPGKSWAEFYRRNEAAILKLSKRYAPGSSRGNKSPRGRSSRQARRQEHDLDEDGEYEIDSGEN